MILSILGTDKTKKGLKIREAVLDGKRLTDLTYDEARGLEHIVFKNRGGFDKLKNKISPIRNGDDTIETLMKGGKAEGKAAKYIRSGLKFIDKLK